MTTLAEYVWPELAVGEPELLLATVAAPLHDLMQAFEQISFLLTNANLRGGATQPDLASSATQTVLDEAQRVASFGRGEIRRVSSLVSTPRLRRQRLMTVGQFDHLLQDTLSRTSDILVHSRIVPSGDHGLRGANQLMAYLLADLVSWNQPRNALIEFDCQDAALILQVTLGRPLHDKPLLIPAAHLYPLLAEWSAEAFTMRLPAAK